jgi:hypothetical protein
LKESCTNIDLNFGMSFRRIEEEREGDGVERKPREGNNMR